MDLTNRPLASAAGTSPADLRSLPTARPLVEIQGVTVAFNNRPALHGVNLAVRSGEVVTLIGPNGSGKTTLIRVLGGLIKADAGKVEKRDGLRIGYVPQRTHIRNSLPMTVARFLALGGKVNRAGVAEALAEVGADGLADASIHQPQFINCQAVSFSGWPWRAR
jgi:zinc transport system ATP-binding protein